MIGEFHHSIDAKRRVQLPTELRAMLSDTVAITQGFEKQINVYAWDVYEQKMEENKKKIDSSKRGRALARFLSFGKKVSVDASGRILIPDTLAQYADLKENAVLQVVGDRIEIWNEDAWNAYRKELEADATTLAEEMDISI